MSHPSPYRGYDTTANSPAYQKHVDEMWGKQLPPRFRTYENGVDITPQELRDRWAAGWRPDYGE